MKRSFLVAFAGLIALSGCSSHRQPEAAQTSRPPVAVKLETAAGVKLPLKYEATGTVRAKTAAVISSKVMAHVLRVNFQAGDHVASGQLLVELDGRDLEAGLRQAEAAEREAREALAETEAAIASAKANLELAQATFRRMEDLFEKRSISRQEFDEATARLRSATAAYDMAAAKRKQVAARIAQASEGIQTAKILLSYARITAPFDGVITEKHVEPGNLAAPGAALAVIERDGAYRLEAEVEESRLSQIRAGQPVTVILDSLNRTLAAGVSEILPSVDPASRTNTVRIDLPPAPGLRSGMFGRAVFSLGERRVLAVPITAVREQGQLQLLFVAEGGRARSRLVTLGDTFDGRREVLSGLREGEQYVAQLPAGLDDGTPLEVRP